MPLVKVSRRTTLRGLFVMLLVLQMTLLTVTPVGAAGSADFSFANGAFRKVWERPDFPVAVQKATRSFTWGPEGWSFREEPYAESPNGKRLVQYFDKTRMEITKPDGDTNSEYYVTNGLLVKEMVAGQVQEGDAKFRTTVPSEVPVAGDPDGNPGPTYRSFKGVVSLNPDSKAPKRTGEIVKATITKDGKTGESDALGNKYQVKYSDYNPELGHNVADVFSKFMSLSGQVYQSEKFVNGPIINSVVAMGFPVAEAYWSRVVVAGVEKDVLIQLFERRVLTYTPDNSDAFKVEMGNVGAHYYAWRYPQQERVAPWAVVKITNDTTCNPITLALGGQDNLTIEVVPGTPKTYKLGPGKYTYKASGCGSVPLEESRTFAPNEQFDWRFFFR